VLLMAFAEDFRLRRLLANPLLAPHVHVVGSRYAILIANLGGLRQAGGSVLVEAFLVLLERIGATTPAWLRKHDKARDGALVLHYLGQLITAIEALNAGIARTATLLPPLAPEGAPATPEPMAVMLRDRWQAVPRGKGTPLDLIAPALNWQPPRRVAARSGKSVWPLMTAPTMLLGCWRDGSGSDCLATPRHIWRSGCASVSRSLQSIRSRLSLSANTSFITKPRRE
jgi:hypothetical protein